MAASAAEDPGSQDDPRRALRSRALREMIHQKAVGMVAEAFGIEPFIAPNGRLGVQFMQFGLDYHYSDQTLLSEIEGLIEALGADPKVSPVVLPELLLWQETLGTAMARIDSLIAEVRMTSPPARGEATVEDRHDQVSAPVTVPITSPESAPVANP